MKKYMRMLLALVFVAVLGLLCGAALAEETTVVASGTCGTNVTWQLDSAGELTISGTGKMEDYSSGSSTPWYSKRYSISKVTIKNGVTSIGDCAFDYCERIKNVDIPNGVTEIGEAAFGNCYSLERIVIPYGVTKIKANTFYQCSNLADVGIPDSVTEIGETAFGFCYGLKSITIPGSVKRIMQSFWGCDGLKDVNIEYGLEIVGESAFKYCKSLESITLPESVTEIGRAAFSMCTNLIEVNIPKKVKSIEEYTFNNCETLPHIVLPDGMESIARCAFSGCRDLHAIAILESVTSIGEYAFEYCDLLEDIWLTGKKTPKFTYPFKNNYYGITVRCYKGSAVETWAKKKDYHVAYIVDPNTLSKVILPDGVTEVQEEAFMNSDVEYVILPEDCKKIGKNAFSGCENLIYIYIPDSVTQIDIPIFKDSEKVIVQCNPGSYAMRRILDTGDKLDVFFWT